MELKFPFILFTTVMYHWQQRKKYMPDVDNGNASPLENG